MNHAGRRRGSRSTFHFHECMFSLDSLGHINVVMTDLEEATRFYQALFGASVEQTFPHFKNLGFARSAGFFGRPRIRQCEHSFLKGFL
jgi:methylmalonyl-CoA/ethylmalonyl-CoA epimerase